MSKLLLYDGDCPFCQRAVDFWRSVTLDRVPALPFQQAGADILARVPIERLKQSVHFLQDDRIYIGAEAVARSLCATPGLGWVAYFYGRSRAFARGADWIYQELAGKRSQATWITRKLWGARSDPPAYQTSVWLFQKLLALFFFTAFLSLGTQVRGLIGAQGILPVDRYLHSLWASGYTFWEAPTLFWWWHGDRALNWACWTGDALAIACLLGWRPRLAFAGMYALYLSLTIAGQIFLGYQWDYLLLETGFLAIFLTPSRPRVWLFRWLLFRLMFESGCVKLLSHDPTWANLTALSYHYQTQPLPTPLAWYAAQFPMWFHRLSAGIVFAIELIVPFILFGTRRMRHFAGFAFAGFQTLIFLTGNYASFNLLSMSLGLLLFDDRCFGTWRGRLHRLDGHPSFALSALLLALCGSVGALQIAAMFRGLTPGPETVAGRISTFGAINSYGLFATMTTVRMEIELQGSQDGIAWRTYSFRYKPGEIRRTLPWIAPHQPRLDWQMWFAALGNHSDSPWLDGLAFRLLTGSPEVLALIGDSPFPETPPAFLRALLYEYRFSTPEDKLRTSARWHKSYKGVYLPPVSLRKLPVR